MTDGLRKLLAPGSEFVVDSADFVAARRGIVAGLRNQDLPYRGHHGSSCSAMCA